MKKCKKCGIEYKEAHLTYDGCTTPYITHKCGKYVGKCNEPGCLFCGINGGHTFISYGEHEWVEVEDD